MPRRACLPTFGFRDRNRGYKERHDSELRFGRMISSLGVFFCFGLACAVPWYRVFTTKITIIEQKFISNNLRVMKHNAKLMIVNPGEISVESRSIKHGKIYCYSDEIAERREAVEYNFHGLFYNSGTLLVQHSNRHVPIRVNFAGRPSTCFWQRSPTITNKGLMAFLSNGPALEDVEFLFDLKNTFHNSERLFFLGTKYHVARARLQVSPGRRWVKTPRNTKNAIENRDGYIFLKNAAVHQAANFTDDAGCIVLGQGSHFHTNVAFSMGRQRIYFKPGNGRATMYIKPSFGAERREYTISNFPEGSEIWLDEDFVLDTSGPRWMQFRSRLTGSFMWIRFLSISTATRPLQFQHGVLSLRDYSTNVATPEHCERVSDVIYQASILELDV